MLICGVKLTHDGGVALVDGTTLVCSVEVEKLDNRQRYAELGSLEIVTRVLADAGILPSDVDRFVVDGWGYGEPRPTVETRSRRGATRLPVAPYREDQLESDSMHVYRFDGLPIGDTIRPYHSFHHTTGHIMSAYCASPFASAGEPSFVLVWDGGVLPRCYYVSPQAPFVENLGPIFGLIGNIYPTFAMHFPPFRPADLGGPADRAAFHQLSVPGKVMAYIALGVVRPELCQEMDSIYEHRLDVAFDYATRFTRDFLDRTGSLSYTPADAMASLQHWIGGRLVRSLRELREREPGRVGNLCFAGGCALNIKWNSTIRDSGVFDRIWVPPFPNDSGSALGAACAQMVAATGRTALDWSVYRGPRLMGLDAHDEFTSRACDVPELADLLHRTGRPVVVLRDRAELGPRALGNRSIIAPATRADMKDHLNLIKGRESYRPVSPICLEHRAPDIFDPGTPDPYMLFEHQVRPEWLARIPAIVHLDGSARLQTVNARQNPVIAALLTEYEHRSGIPVLCNTSANLSGSGFFPDTRSALDWGRVPMVWCDGTLWERAKERVGG